MPYRRVQFAPGQYYHVFNRCIGRQPIFREADKAFVKGLFATGTAYDEFVQAYVEGLSELPRGTNAFLID